MNNCHHFIFLTLFQLTLGVQTTLKKGQTFTFPLPEISEGAFIKEIEWKRHISNETKVLARILISNGQKYDSKIYSKRTGMHIMENGTLHMEDINDEDSGNYSCTIVFDNQTTQKLQIYLQVLPDFLPTQGPKQHSPVHNSTKPAEPHVPTITLLIVIPVCSALALVFVIVVTIIIFRCGKKYCSTSEEPMYINKAAVHKSRK